MKNLKIILILIVVSLYSCVKTDTVSKEEKIELMSTSLDPVGQVKAFFLDIVNKDYSEAHRRQKNILWSDFERFKSTEHGYGGVSKIEFYNSEILSQSEDVAEVYLYYYAEDPYNKNGKYHQYFKLKRLNDEWLITNSKLIHPTKIFYDENWKVVKFPEEANYYRKVLLDKKGRPYGITQDFYLTGELQWQGKLTYVDTVDNSKDIMEGICTWYYKNGNKSRQSLMRNGKEEGKTIFWYEDGKIAREIEYSEGKLNGKLVEYYPSGKKHYIIEFENDLPKDKWIIECDEQGICEKLFYDDFLDNNNEWEIKNDQLVKSEIFDGKLFVRTYSDLGGMSKIYLPLDIDNDFSLETYSYNVTGNWDGIYGLIWGFNDYDNYQYFLINTGGYYKIGMRIDGINIPITTWERSDNINIGGRANRLKIKKVNEYIYFVINGTLLKRETFYPLKGNYMGVFVMGDNQLVSFDNFIVRHELKDTHYSRNSEVNENFNKWNGNGTGFIIDKKGYIITNYHVIKDANEIEISQTINGNQRSFRAIVVRNDIQNDLSILKINDSDFEISQSIPFSIVSEVCDVGSEVFTLGYPMALNVLGDEIKFTDGRVSSRTGYQGSLTTYQITVPVQPGNSGGPLFDYNGNLIGIVNAKIPGADNVSYAIKSIFLKNLIDSTPQKIVTPTINTISDKTLTDKIKILSNYVVMIKVR